MKRETERAVYNIFFKRQVFWHLIFWITATVYLMLAFRNRFNNFGEIFKVTIFYLPGHIFLVYVLLYLLIPYFLIRRKFLLFFLCFVPAFIISAFYIRFVDTRILHSSESFLNSRVFFRAVFANFNLCGIAAAIKLLKYWYQEREAKQEAEKVTLISRLQVLKSQVHPHFLFNTLNNIYSLSLKNSPKTPLIVLKLSSLLRYMLYDCNSAEISLEKEIDMIRSYVELEKIRFDQRLDLAIHCSGDMQDKHIAPLLLLPFLENCFKHGVSQQIDQCWVFIDFLVDNNTFHAKFINSRLNTEEASAEPAGIGLTNVRRRLDLLYGNNYKLKIMPAEETFTVSLILSFGGSGLNHELN